jgi:hypothetical protein
MAWQLMTKLLLAAIATILLSGAAHAEETMQCSPKDNTVRILKSANPNDTAPGWKMAIVGTAGYVLQARPRQRSERGLCGDPPPKTAFLGWQSCPFSQADESYRVFLKREDGEREG